MQTSNKTLRALFCSGLMLLVSACAVTPDELELLDKSFMAYERALRWQDYDLVIGFHKNEQKKLTPEKRKYLKQFRVTGYNVVHSNVEVDNKHAKQIIELKYYNIEVATLKEITVQNQWEYDDKTFRWQLTNDFPDFK